MSVGRCVLTFFAWCTPGLRDISMGALNAPMYGTQQTHMYRQTKKAAILQGGHVYILLEWSIRSLRHSLHSQMIR